MRVNVAHAQTSSSVDVLPVRIGSEQRCSQLRQHLNIDTYNTRDKGLEPKVWGGGCVSDAREVGSIIK